jgi:hypothetical protein
MSARFFYAIAAAAVLGCASAGTSGAPPNRSLITDEEIAAAHVTSAYDAVERLRPLWLRSHGETSIVRQGTEYANVYVDGQRYGDLSSLRGLQAMHVLEMRYYNGPEGATKFGLQNSGGVIEVKLK